jgi:hypothetical protein
MQRGGAKKIYHFYNRYHYGDNVMNLYFFRAISDKIKANNSIVYYYYNTQYIKNPDELFRYVDPDTIVILPLEQKPEDAVELWHGNPIGDVKQFDIENYYKLLYKNIVKHMNISEEGINFSLFQDQPYLKDAYDKLDNKYKDLDILIINGTPKTEIKAFNKDIFNDISKRLAEKYKVVTTEKVADNVVSTRDNHLKLQDIGAIATKDKYVIGMHTGPLMACYSKQAKEYVKKWFIVAASKYNYTEIPHEFYLSSDNLKDIESKIEL